MVAWRLDRLGVEGLTVKFDAILFRLSGYFRYGSVICKRMGDSEESSKSRGKFNKKPNSRIFLPAKISYHGVVRAFSSLTTATIDLLAILRKNLNRTILCNIL